MFYDPFFAPLPSLEKTTISPGRANLGHLPYLDGLRGVAILTVLCFHCLYPAFGFDKLPWAGLMRDWGYSWEFLLVYPFSLGYLGVAIFFVISGYCIHLSHMRNPRDGWAGFFIRRWFRIYPAYLFAIALFLFIPPWGGPWMNLERLTQLVANLLAVQNLWEDLRFGINPSFWSIAVEIQLYLIYPLLLALVRRSDWRTALILTASLELLLRMLPFFLPRSGLPQLPFALRGSPFFFWASWSIGAYLSEIHMQQKAPLFARIRFDLVLVLTVLSAQFKPTQNLAFPLCALATALAMDRIHQGRWKLATEGWAHWLWAHLSRLGVVSYSFYLFHQPILNKVGKGLREALPPLAIVGCMLLLYPLVLLVARLGHRYLEVPSIALGRSAITYLRSRRGLGS